MSLQPVSPAHGSLASRGGDPLDDGQSARQNVLRLLAIVRRRWWVPAAIAATALAMLLTYQALKPAQYVSKGLIQLGMYAHLTPDEAQYRPSHLEFLETHTKLLSSNAVVDDALRIQGHALAPAAERQLQRDWFLAGVAIRPVRQTYLIEVQGVAGDPHTAASNANALMDAFVPFTAWWFLGSRYVEREQSLQSKERVVLEKLAAAEERQRTFYKEAGSVPYEDLRLGLHASKASLQEQLTARQIERSVAETERDRMRRRIEEVAQAERPEELIGLFGRHALLDRQQRIADLKSRLIHLNTSVQLERLAELPEFLAVSGRLRGEREALREEMRSLAVAGLEAHIEDVATLTSRAEKIQELLAGLDSELRRLDLLEGEFRTIRREVEWYDKELEETRAALRALQAQGKVDGGAKIINRAEVPGAPEPRFRLTNAFFVALLAFALGLVTIVAWDHFDDTVRGEDDAARLGLSVLGQVPRIDLTHIDEVAHAEGSSWLAESFGLIRTNLSVAAGGDLQGAILVTSACPGEGKSLISLNLAGALARSGGRTLLIEGDLRRPGLHGILGVEGKLGLVDVLEGRASLEDAVERCDLPGVDLLPSGLCPLNPADAFIRGQFDAVVRAAVERYDHVVVDAPPARGLADTSLMAPYVHGVVVVARDGRSRRSQLQAAVEQISLVGGRILGVVINDITDEGDATYQYYGNGDGPGLEGAPSPDEPLFLVTVPKDARSRR